MSAITPFLRSLAIGASALWMAAANTFAASGDVDTTFSQWAARVTRCIAVRSDGRAVVAQPSTGNNVSLLRLNENGRNDVTFSATTNGTVRCMVAQPDGKILIGGNFTSVSGVPRRHIARLLEDGSVDPTFNLEANGWVSAINVMPDGSILFGGWFTQVAGQTRHSIAKASSTGELLPFAPFVGGQCLAIHIQADGNILIGGYFSRIVNSEVYSNAARLSAEGVFDDTFLPNSNHLVTWISEQPGGKVLMMNSLSPDAPEFSRFTRVDAITGADDTTFNTSLTLGASIHAIYMQTDGKVLIAGRFQYLNSTYQLARLRADGLYDPSFTPVAGTDPIRTMAPLPDGRLLVGGDFTKIRTTSVTGLTRLQGDAFSSPLVAPDASTVEWQRGANAPVFARVTFESRTGNGPWTFLGHGQRTNNHWRLEGTTLPANGVIRARGFMQGTPNGSIHTEYLSLGTTHPQLTIEHAGTIIPAGEALPIGDVLTELKWSYDFKLTNTGDQKLEQINIPTFNGIEYPVFPPPSLGPGESAIIRIELTPMAAGPIDYSFTIASNADNAPSYVVRLTGNSTLVFSPVVNSPTDVPAPGGGKFHSSQTFGQLTLGFAPQPGTVITLVKGLTSSATLLNLPNGAIVSADYNGVTYQFVAGQGNELNFPLTLRLSLLGADGVFKRTLEGVTNGVPLAMEDDGSYRVSQYRVDATGVQDKVFGTSALTLGTPKHLSLVNGDMYYANGTTVPAPILVRLRNDGSQDQSFNAPINGHVVAMVAQPDGRLVIGGGFTTVSGVARTSLARLHPDGSVDTDFTPQIDLNNVGVKTLAVQADGKILIGTTNAMTLPGVGSTNVARLLPSGALDTGFALPATVADRLLIQPDGKIVKLAFSSPYAESLRRYLPDGTVDGGFSVAANGAVQDLALLADGKMLVSGTFTQIGEHACTGIARLHPDGTPDVSFFARTIAGPTQILVDGKNRLLIAAKFGSANGVGAAIVELSNSSAVSQVAMVNANTIRWTRQGGAAELDWVKAELIPQSGAPVSLGLAQRVSGGWEITSPTPVSNATVRLYGPATHATGMITMVKEMLEVGIVTPQLVATRNQQPLSTTVANDLGNRQGGIGTIELIRMENRGAGSLPAPLVTIEGPNAADFSIVQSSATPLAAGEQRSLRLWIYPTDGGTRTAQLVFRSTEQGPPLQVIPLTLQSNNVLNPVFNSAGEIPVSGVSFNAGVMRFGTFTLNYAPAPGTILTLVSNSSGSLTGRFLDLPHPGIVSAVYNGVTYHFGLNYAGGSGNDLTLKLLGNGDISPDFRGSADNWAHGVAIQPDGKVIVTGFFDMIGNTPRDGIARLHPNGEVDTSFNVAQFGQVENITVLDDDRILMAGPVTVNGIQETGIVCLNPDGSRSADFALNFGYTETIRAQVVRLLKLRNGKFMVGGLFTSVNGELRTNLARLNADGTLDTTFTTAINGHAPNPGYVYSISEQADGKLLIGGSFGSVNGTTRYCLARLNADGSLDEGFNPLFGPNTSATYGDPYGTRVSTTMELPDGRILLGGKFSTISGSPRTNFACLKADGTVDTSFNLVADNVVSSLLMQADGKVLVGGLFTTFGSQTRWRIVRLNADGTVDPNYGPRAGSTVSGMALDRQGNLWVTGSFAAMNGVTANGVAKLRNDSGSTALTLGLGNAFWEVTGTAPALSEVKFELSTDGGTVWTPLGNGTKVTGGWTISGLTLPPHGYLRAKGKAIGGNRGFSAIEDVILFGRQPTKIEEWRMQQFGSFTNQRTGADLADADKDGVANLMEYAFGLDPQDTTSAEVPAWFDDGSQFELSFLPPPGIEGVTYGAEWSSTMNPSDWHNVPNQGTGSDQRYVVPKDATPFKFMRLKVTNMSSVPPP